MNSQNQMNKFQNISKNKLKENSKTNINKPAGSTTYSKNKKSLEKMLREYQTFCKKYFGESTPIGSMTEERMNKLLEDENNFKDKELIEEDKHHFLETLEVNNKNNFNSEEICDKLPMDIFYNENSVLGNHKNNKNDYKQRNKILFNENTKKEEKNENEEYNDFDNKENNEMEHKENIEEIKNLKAKEIQRVYREKRFKNKERIYFGYDKDKLNILKIYIDDLDDSGNIIKLDINKYSIKENKSIFFKKSINDLLNVESISKDKLIQSLEDIIPKIDCMDKNEKISEKNEKEKKKKKDNKKEKEEEKVLDEDGEEYTF